MKYTLDDLKKDEKNWKDVILINELILVKRFLSVGLHLAYEEAELNAWIIKTLMDKKQRYKFKTTKNIVLVGSGVYPYSMFDLHKQYPHINQVGLEIVNKRAILSRKLVEASPAKDKIKILSVDGLEFDYSWMTDDDFVFISVDVDVDKIFKRVIETSKAHPLVCAPYKNTWIKNLFTVSFSSS
tara:strand:- start:2830 stop:3381 length:552 start_codon:yes stop_codon:yes gene_type:complete